MRILEGEKDVEFTGIHAESDDDLCIFTISYPRATG